MKFNIIYNGYEIRYYMSYHGSPEKPANLMYFYVNVDLMALETMRFISLEETMAYIAAI